MKTPKQRFREIARINQYAKGCLRDTADRDYVTSRVAYRCGFVQQFLYLAHQAVEKYLKAILLFNSHYAQFKKIPLIHDLNALYRRVKERSDLQVDFPEKVDKFIAFLNEVGISRYLDYPLRTYGDDMLTLDWTVWHLRRYCQCFDYPNKGKKEAAGLRQNALRRVRQEHWKDKPHKFKLHNGHLERILNNKRKTEEEGRRALVWKNPCYGARRKRTIKRYLYRISSTIPSHYTGDMESFRMISRKMSFPADVLKDVEKRGGRLFAGRVTKKQDETAIDLQHPA